MVHGRSTDDISATLLLCCVPVCLLAAAPIPPKSLFPLKHGDHSAGAQVKTDGKVVHMLLATAAELSAETVIEKLNAG